MRNVTTVPPTAVTTGHTVDHYHRSFRAAPVLVLRHSSTVVECGQPNEVRASGQPERSGGRQHHGLDPLGGRALVCNVNPGPSPLSLAHTRPGLVHICRRVKTRACSLGANLCGSDRSTGSGLQADARTSFGCPRDGWLDRRCGSGSLAAEERHRDGGGGLCGRQNAGWGGKWLVCSLSEWFGRVLHLEVCQW
jgi:hypothetical protein